MRVNVSSRMSLLSAAGAVAAAVVLALGVAFHHAEGQEPAGGPSSAGATYYVDFETGKDENSGRLPAAAFKHCPGDTEATAMAKGVKLAAGDKVIFKGGVDYRGTVTVAWSGKEGQPIVYDGNTEGKFGQGKAIIQGGEPVTGWRKVASAEEVEQNPHWKELYYTYLPDSRTFFNFGLFEGDDYLAASQDPKPDDPFFFDRVGCLPDFAHEPTRNRSPMPSISRLPDPDYYAGAYLALHIQPNYVCCQAITGYVPAEHKVTYKPHGQGVYRRHPTLRAAEQPQNPQPSGRILSRREERQGRQGAAGHLAAQARSERPGERHHQHPPPRFPDPERQPCRHRRLQDLPSRRPPQGSRHLEAGRSVQHRTSSSAITRSTAAGPA